jgi:hypothetical protein
MMKPSLHAAAAISLGLLTGFFAARAPSESSGDLTAPLPQAAESSSHSRSRPASRLELRAHNLKSLLHLDWARLWRDDLDRQLAATDTAGLKRLLEAAAADRVRTVCRSNLRSRMIRELYQREKSGAVSWAAEQHSHPEVLGGFIGLLARDDLEAALAWVEPFRNQASAYFKVHRELPQVEERVALLMVRGAISRAALAQDAMTAARVYGLLGGLAFGQLPENFDHAAFMAAVELENLRDMGGATDFFDSWACRDRDAALASARMMEQRDPETAIGLVSAVFRGVCRLEGESAAAKWLSATIASEPSAQRSELIFRLYPYSFWLPSPAAFRRLCDALDNDDDRLVLAASFIDPSLGPGDSGSYLEAFPTVDQRAAVIEAAAHHSAANTPSPNHAASYRERFSELTNSTDFPSAVRARVLALWPE